MATARQYITRAMRLVRVLASGETPTSEEAADGLLAFNDMLEAWKLDGIDFGLAAFGLDDEVYIPAEYERAVRYNLAVEIAPEYGAEIPSVVAARADEGMRLIRGWQADVDELEIDPALTWGQRFRGWLI